MRQFLTKKLYQTSEHTLWHFCPGCQTPHPIPLRTPEQYNGWSGPENPQLPTFNPSLGQHAKGGYCHYFITHGKIHFLDDCWHELKGQTVELPDYPAEETL